MVKLTDYIDSENCIKKISFIEEFARNNTAFREKTQAVADRLFRSHSREGFLDGLAEIRETFSASLKENASAVSLYLYSLGFPVFIEQQRALGIPERILTDTVRDINVWIGNHKAMYKEDGFSQDGWIVNHFLGELYQIGRLQFQTAKYDNPTEVYHKGNSLLVVAKGGVALEEDGDFLYQKPEYKKTIYQKAGDTLIAHTVDQITGLISLEPETIDLNCWEPVLTGQEDVLSIHIPAIGKMDFEQCVQSIKDAQSFFDRYFPQQDFKALICISWLLSNEAREMLNPQSNIVRFSNLFTRNIAKGHYYLIDKWIFGMDTEDPLAVKPTSTLMKKTQELIRSGGQIYERGGFILI